MTYPFVQAKWYSPGAIVEVRALVIHFAEGGGTVNYFTHPTIDVSSHFVLQYDGTIVQMVRDGDADHCQHTDSGSWSYPGDLTPDNGRAVLGSEVMDNADHTRVNRYVHAIEIEGFRDKGMNDAQHAALIAWVAERRAKFPSIRGLLGHGDVQNKGCPGRLIPWADLGGHGLPQEQPDMEWTNYVAKGEDWHPSVRADASDAPVRLVPDRATAIAVRLPAGSTIRTIGEFLRAGENWRVTRLADGRTGFIIRGDLVPVTAGGDPAVDKPLLDYVQRLDTSAAAVTQALDHVQPAAEAVLTAIQEARPR